MAAAAAGRTVVVVTGASRGFGRCAAVEVARSLAATPSKLVLVARSLEKLEETKAEVLKVSDSATVVTLSLDLSDLDSLEDSVSAMLAAVGPATETSRLLFFNNAASLGTLGPTSKFDSLEFLRKTIDFNVTSALWIQARVLQFIAGCAAVEGGLPSALVHISSLAALQPFPTWSMYCSGKAARDMFTATQAEEEKGKETQVKFLNYAPGPMDTDMQGAIRESDDVDPKLKEFFISAKADNKLVDPYESAGKMATLLAENHFASGAHIDFYDENPGPKDDGAS